MIDPTASTPADFQHISPPSPQSEPANPAVSSKTHTIAGGLPPIHGLTTVIEWAIQVVQHCTQASAVSVYHLDTEARVLHRLPYGLENPLSAVQPMVLPERSLGTLAIASGKVIASPDILTDDRVDRLIKDAFRRLKVAKISAVSAPLMFQNHVYGTLDIFSLDDYELSAKDAEALGLIGSAIALALKSTDDFAQIEASIIEQERSRFQLILDTIAEGIGITLSDTNATKPVRPFVSHTIYDLFGLTADGFDLRWLTHPLTQAEPQQHETIEPGNTIGSRQSEAVFPHRNDSETRDIMTTVRIDSPTGESMNSAASVRERSQADDGAEWRSQVATVAAHELRTPIANLRTRLYLARKKPEMMETHLRILDHLTDQLATLVDDLLDESRLERNNITLSKQEVVLQDMLAPILEIQRAEAEQAQVSLEADFPLEPLKVVLDIARLRRVMTNLIMNAIEHTPQGGWISVRAYRERLRSDYGEAKYVRLEVCDSGTGISPEQLPHIFEPFYQGKKRASGIGLGLAIAKEIVELHGGTISVESKLGKGTCFSIRLGVGSPGINKTRRS